MTNSLTPEEYEEFVRQMLVYGSCAILYSVDKPPRIIPPNEFLLFGPEPEST